VTRIAAAAAAALALAVSVPFSASAEDFGRTTWGMDLAQVRKLYPGGTVATGEADNTVYFVYGPFGPIKNAQILFGFPGWALTYVRIGFPRPGTAPAPDAITYTTMTNDQASEVLASLRAYLGKKHGKPSAEDVRPIGDRTRLYLEWEAHGTPGTLIQLVRQPLEEAGDLTDVTLEYTDGSVYGFSKDKAPPPDCSVTQRSYTSLKSIERDRECAIGKTGRLTCKLDRVEAGSMQARCGEDPIGFGYAEEDRPKVATLKPGIRYEFTVKVKECNWAEIDLRFIDARPATVGAPATR